ncbi:MAG: hypothetical protein GF398_13745 [Chitinivibrionales bacterium]|nr:hypothetical protein [Chitinivibrionales bacterium]
MRLFLTLPPDGAAREVAEQVAAALTIPEFKVFDTAKYLTAFKAMLKAPGKELAVDLLNQSLIVQALDFAATHVLVTALSPVTLFSLNLLRKHNIKTAHWFYEDFKRAIYWQDVVAGYDAFYAVQRGEIERVCGARHIDFALLPTASSLSATVSTVKNYDIAFIGIPSRYRIRILENLAHNGLSLAIAGSGWTGYTGILAGSIMSSDWINARDGAKLLSAARIGLNLSYAPPIDNPDAQLSPRAYDILASATLLLTEKTPLASELLDGYAYRTFSPDEDIVLIVRQMLDSYPDAHPAMQSNIEMVRTRDTYSARTKQLLEMLTGL